MSCATSQSLHDAQITIYADWYLDLAEGILQEDVLLHWVLYFPLLGRLQKRNRPNVLLAVAEPRLQSRHSLHEKWSSPGHGSSWERLAPSFGAVFASRIGHQTTQMSSHPPQAASTPPAV
jgi:hypothetical protein